MTSSRKLFIDLETSSSTDLSKTGVYRYAESEDFQILLFAFSIDGGPVDVIDMKHFEALPDFLIEAILDPDVIKVAHNAAFERICLSRYFRDLGMLDDNEFLDPEDWQCSMVHAATLGLPLSLDQLSQVLTLNGQSSRKAERSLRCSAAVPSSMKIQRNGSFSRSTTGEMWRRKLRSSSG